MKKLLLALTALSFFSTTLYAVVADASQKKDVKVAKKATKSAKAKSKAKK